jgi:predicted ATPase with chaperone activity
LSPRAYSRVRNVGRTIADLAGAEEIQVCHIAEAIQHWEPGSANVTAKLDRLSSSPRH